MEPRPSESNAASDSDDDGAARAMSAPASAASSTSSAGSASASASASGSSSAAAPAPNAMALALAFRVAVARMAAGIADGDGDGVRLVLPTGLTSDDDDDNEKEAAEEGDEEDQRGGEGDCGDTPGAAGAGDSTRDGDAAGGAAADSDDDRPAPPPPPPAPYPASTAKVAEAAARFQPVHSQQGRGAFDYVVTDRSTGSEALAIVHTRGTVEGMSERQIRLAALHAEVPEHPYMLRLLASAWRSRDADKPGMSVYEDTGKCVGDAVRADPRRFDAAAVKRMALHVLRGLEHLHAHGVIFRALNDRRVFTDGPELRTFKLGALDGARFAGYASSYEKSMPDRRGDSTRCFTPRYTAPQFIAPEVRLGLAAYTTKVDLFALGMLIATVCRRGEQLIRPEADAHALVALFQLVGTPTLETCPVLCRLPDWHFGWPVFPSGQGDEALRAEISPGVLDDEGLLFLRALLHPDPSRRPSAREALRHPWLADAIAAEA